MTSIDHNVQMFLETFSAVFYIIFATAQDRIRKERTRRRRTVKLLTT